MVRERLPTSDREISAAAQGARSVAVPLEGGPDAKRTGFRRILWPTDLSPAARAALPHVIHLAELEHAQVVVLHVLPAVIYPIPELSSSLWEQCYEQSGSTPGKR